MQFTQPGFGFFNRKPYKIGVALSGGGARGFAHAGALQALEDMGIKPNLLAGVSAGSVVCVLYSAGKTPMEIVKAFSEAKFSDFARLGVPKDGFFKLDGFKKFLIEQLGEYKNIENLPIPTVIGATNIDTCSAELFEDGEITERVLASCAIPLIFKPQRINGNHYVDGGVLHNLPAWAIRSRCKYLIGINCSPVIPSRYKASLVNIAYRSYNMMSRQNTKSDLELCDLAIEILNIADYKVFNLREIKKVYRAGYEATMEALIANGFKSPSTIKKKKRFRFPF